MSAKQTTAGLSCEALPCQPAAEGPKWCTPGVEQITRRSGASFCPLAFSGGGRIQGPASSGAASSLRRDPEPGVARVGTGSRRERKTLRCAPETRQTAEPQVSRAAIREDAGAPSFSSLPRGVQFYPRSCKRLSGKLVRHLRDTLVRAMCFRATQITEAWVT